MAEQIRKSLSIVAEEVLSVDVTRPRLTDQSGQVEAAILSKSGRLREVEMQIADLLSQFEDSVRSGSLLEERARIGKELRSRRCHHMTTRHWARGLGG